jgi:hypothetical protein
MIYHMVPLSRGGKFDEFLFKQADTRSADYVIKHSVLYFSREICSKSS